jgi:putative flavoprotein involved in K+ transport
MGTRDDPAAVPYGSNRTEDTMDDQYDVAVVGGGQAGLAIGYWLAQQRRSFVILEGGDSVATAWRNRWDSLVLFTSRRYDALPGLAFPGDPDGYPGRQEVTSYLERYVSEFNLPVQPNSHVRSLSTEDGWFVLDLGERHVLARQVVVATGPFQLPRTPSIADGLAADVFQMHSSEYRRPSEIPGGVVLVVGGGNTGYQIAKELSTTHQVHLAVGSRQTPVPQRLLGRDVFWWLDKIGVLKKSVDSRIGRRARDGGRDTLIGSSPRQARRLGVQLHSRAVAAEGHTVAFQDGSAVTPSAVIWATGYHIDHSWIHLPIFNDDGSARHRRGVTDVPGFYFLGLPWQYTRGSALLGWVKHDTQFLAEQIATNHDALTTTTAAVTAETSQRS